MPPRQPVLAEPRFRFDEKKNGVPNWSGAISIQTFSSFCQMRNSPGVSFASLITSANGFAAARLRRGRAAAARDGCRRRRRRALAGALAARRRPLRLRQSWSRRLRGGRGDRRGLGVGAAVERRPGRAAPTSGARDEAAASEGEHRESPRTDGDRGATRERDDGSVYARFAAAAEPCVSRRRRARRAANAAARAVIVDVDVACRRASASPAKLTTRLLSVRAASSLASLAARPVTSTRWRVPTIASL